MIFTGVTLVKSKLLYPHLNPKIIREFSENELSWLTDIEKWLEAKTGFEVQIFSIVQKQYLLFKSDKHMSYRVGNEMHVSPAIYERILNETSK